MDNRKKDHLNKIWTKLDPDLETNIQNMACLSKTIPPCNTEPELKKALLIKKRIINLRITDWKVLFGNQINGCSKMFFFYKITYKSPSHSSTSDKYSSFLLLLWLKTNVFPISTLLCRGTSDKDLRMQTIHYLQIKKWWTWRWVCWGVFIAGSSSGVYH